MVRILSPDDIESLKSKKMEPLKKSTPMQDRFPSEMLINSDFHQRAAAKLDAASEMKSTRPVTTKPIPNAGQPITTRVPGKVEDKWVRQQFPSKGLTYNEEIFVRPLEIPVLKRLAAARAANEKDVGFTMMLDALQSRINIDIRSLTVPDLYFFIYWLKLNSYPRSSMTIEWTSKYGNSQTSVIRETSNLNIIELSITKDELEYYQTQLGLTIPTVRDMEILMANDLSAADAWEVEYAQYIYLEGEIDSQYLQKKIDILNSSDPDFLSEIDEFSAKLNHGVIEDIECTDALFELDAAIAFMEKELAILSKSLELLQSGADPSQNATAVLALLQHMEERNKCLTDLKKAKEEGLPYTPEKEVVNIGTPDINTLF